MSNETQNTAQVASEVLAQNLVERYIAAWNEANPAHRNTLIAQTFADDVRYIDPLMEGQGHAGINALVQGVQAQFAGHRFRQIGRIDTHHDWVRFSWALAPADGPALVGGTDIARIGADGRLQSVTGFLDLVPGAA